MSSCTNQQSNDAKASGKRVPLKSKGFKGKDGQALINNDASKLRLDNIYVENHVEWCADRYVGLLDAQGNPINDDDGNPRTQLVKGCMPFKTRPGLDKAIFSGGEMVHIVSKTYGHLPNETFFGSIDDKLKEKDIKVITRAINRNNRAFCVDHILNDDRYAVIVKKNTQDVIRPMLIFTNSYDGSTKTQGIFGFWRKVCDNGLHVSTSEIGFSMRHRGDIIDIVVPEIDLLLERFMDNEFFQIKKKFEVLAETPIVNIAEYVKMTCEETGIFKFQKSEENEEASVNASLVIELIRKEARLLGEAPNLWLGFNSFNNILHNKMRKGFQAAFTADKNLFEYNLALAEN